MGRHPLVVCACSAIAVAVATLSLRAQLPAAAPAPFVAYRLDGERVVAVLRADDGRTIETPPTVSASMSGFGFVPVSLPDGWADLRPAGIATGDRWIVRIGGAERVDAVVEEIVAGQLSCMSGVGVQLRIAPAHRAAFASQRAK